MIRVDRTEEPPTFDADVRKPGNAWLQENPDAKARQIRDRWSPYRGHLAEGFRHLCGYSAMLIRPGTVDHYRSRDTHPTLAYEWDNYRYAAAEMNQRKGTCDDRILDPFEIEDGWFEILLPSLELVPVEDRIPAAQQERARFTLKRLGLRDHPNVIGSRTAWYERFTAGALTLEGLFDVAPLIARAVEKRFAYINPAHFEDEQTPLRRFLDSEITLKGLRSLAPRLADAIDAALRRPDERTRRR
ncbi:hypothetical protein [Polyangium fumosum]|uniref:Uncharacterized protein n=1 Tax=Polyangium fumosum TaxID=889272 RepID=A0A4U1J488_9BACT|nr:hypothetical protein [Polyangium fumosum]TKD01972.1 hypothetical protein E8A74_29335 [Polyangium fumosum]